MEFHMQEERATSLYKPVLESVVQRNFITSEVVESISAIVEENPTLKKIIYTHAKDIYDTIDKIPGETTKTIAQKWCLEEVMKVLEFETPSKKKRAKNNKPKDQKLTQELAPKNISAPVISPKTPSPTPKKESIAHPKQEEVDLYDHFELDENSLLETEWSPILNEYNEELEDSFETTRVEFCKELKNVSGDISDFALYDFVEDIFNGYLDRIRVCIAIWKKRNRQYLEMTKPSDAFRINQLLNTCAERFKSDFTDIKVSENIPSFKAGLESGNFPFFHSALRRYKKELEDLALSYSINTTTLPL